MSSPQTWQVVIQKQYQTEYWVNDYHVQAISPTDAKIKADAIIEVERAIHRMDVAFVNYRVRLASSLGQGTVYPIGETGEKSPGTYVGLFNVARVDCGCELGRPGRKYLRLPIANDMILFGQFSSASITSINDAYAIPLQNLGFVCKPNGQLFTYCRVNPTVGMRQLRRGSRRRSEPII